MKTLQEIKKDLLVLKKQNLADIAHFQSEIEKNDSKIAAAQQKLFKAQEAIDAKAYSEAKSELWLAESTKEMLVKQLNKLTQEPLMPIDEYRQLVKYVHEKHEKTQAGFFTEAESVLPKLENICEKARVEFEDCREVLNILKVTVSKDREEYKKSEKGHLDSTLFDMTPRVEKYFPQVFDDIARRIR